MLQFAVKFFFIILLATCTSSASADSINMNIKTQYVDTQAGKIAYLESTGKSKPTIILIHGNSASKEFMRKQLDGLGHDYKVIALDLPGHGESDNATSPSSDYTIPGYTHTVAEVIKALEVGPVILVGWSLGGHIAIDFMEEYPELLLGAFVISTPPFSPTKEGFKEAYLPTYSSSLGSKLEPFTPEEVKEYMTQGGIDFDTNPELLAGGCRAHGLARQTMVNHVMDGKLKDQREIVETSPIPLGIVAGKEEHAINNDYIKSLDYANCLILRTLEGGHDLQWSHPKGVIQALRDFIGMTSASGE